MIEFSVLISGASEAPHGAVLMIKKTVLGLDPHLGPGAVCTPLRTKTSVGYAPEDLVTVEKLVKEGQELLVKVVHGDMSKDQIRAAGQLMTILRKIEVRNF